MEATAPAQRPTSFLLRYRNRDIDEQALAEVRAIVEKTWDRSRREMALALCREWGWRKVGGEWDSLLSEVCKIGAGVLSDHRHCPKCRIRMQGIRGGGEMCPQCGHHGPARVEIL